MESADKKLAPALAAPNWNPAPSSWRLGGGAALVVNFGLFEVAGGHVHRVSPCVYRDEESGVACAFIGFLSNLDELTERHCDPGAVSAGSPKAVAARDPREAAAHLVYRMYARGDDPLILLSELQGQFSFALVDAERRVVVAARDPSGREPLFLDIADDGSVSLSNARLAVAAPDGGAAVRWAELPPGHFLASAKGAPKVKQFALTPAELSAREYYDTLEDELSPTAAAAADAATSRRRSLSDDFADFGIVD